MGLGDALYVQSIARHLVEQGETLKVHTSWPDVFKPLGDKVQLRPFTRAGVDILAHYSLRKSKPTNQFEDCVIQAGIKGPVDLKIDWLAEPLIGEDRPIICVQLPRSPMGRTDGFGKELLPDCRIIQRAIDRLGKEALIVQIGSGEALFKFSGIDVDLSNKTTVSQMLDIASIASGFLGYVSFMVPLAESFRKPGLFVWSSRGLHAGHCYVRQITPKKVLSRESSQHVFDDWPTEQIDSGIESFLRQVKSGIDSQRKADCVDR